MVDGAAFRSILNSTWNMTREEIMVELATLANEVDAVYMTPMINKYLLVSDEHARPQTHFRTTGMEALLGARCSDTLKSYGQGRPALQVLHDAARGPASRNAAPRGGTRTRRGSGQFLELADSKDAKPSEEFLDRLAKGASPPPSPPPSPQPPPPPSPPEPPPPPRPPVAISLAEGRAIAKKIERRFCDAVYLLSAQARCSRLATRMQLAFVLGDGFAARARAAAAAGKASPPPPPRPPRPSLPALEARRAV